VLAKIGGVGVVVTPAGDIVRWKMANFFAPGCSPTGFTTPLIEGNMLYVIDAEAGRWSALKAEKGMKPIERWKIALGGDFMASRVPGRPHLHDREPGSFLLPRCEGRQGPVVTKQVDEATKAEKTEPGRRIEGLAPAQYLYAGPAADDKHIFFFDDAGNALCSSSAGSTGFSASISSRKGSSGRPSSLATGSSSAVENVYCVGEKR